MFTAYDAVTADNLPADADYAFYYMDGAFRNESAVRARCPHAILFSITVLGDLRADIADCEPGCMSPFQTVGWVGAKVRRGHKRPRIYADLATWGDQTFTDRIAKAAPSARRALALWDDDPAVPEGYAAKQFRSTSALDTWTLLQEFLD